jgi:hypothetical protein
MATAAVNPSRTGSPLESITEILLSERRRTVDATKRHERGDAMPPAYLPGTAAEHFTEARRFPAH